MAFIECRNVSFSYEGNLVISELNFSVNRGDYLCVVGENGSGKSTLIKGILRLKQPQSGSIRTDDSLKANEIGYLPQQTAVQKDFPASTYEVIISGRLNTRGIFPFYSKADKIIAEKNIELLKIEDLRNKCYRELSWGQQRRALLARALCSAQKILILDEPVAGLDPVMTRDLYKTIEKINREMGITIIMVSHDIHSAVKYATHMLHLENTQVFFGETKDYINSGVGSGFLENKGEQDG